MPGLNLDENNATFQITAFSPGKITINQTDYHQNLIITPDTLITDWPVENMEKLTPASLDIILSLKPDVLLIGTGTSLIFPMPALYGHLINQGIGVEMMNTAAACRTYSALSAENRLVAAALFIR